MVISAQVSPAQQPGDATAREYIGGPCRSGTQLAQGGGGEGPSGGVRCLALGPGAWAVLQSPVDPVLVPEQHVGLGAAGCPLGVTLTDPHCGLTSSGPGTPAALGPSGCIAGGLLAGAESACVRLHQSPRSTPLQVRDPHPDWWLWLGEGTGTPGGAGSLWSLWEQSGPRALWGWEDGMLCRHEASGSVPASFPVCRQYRESRAFSFCVAGRWAASERVASDGTGLRGIWWRQIRQFHRVSPAVAHAIVTAFPSPRLLQQVGPLAPLLVWSQVPQSCPAYPRACPRHTRAAARSRSAWPSWQTSP